MSLKSRLATALSIVLLLIAGMSVAVVILQQARLVDQLDQRLISIAPLGRTDGAGPPPNPAGSGQPAPSVAPGPLPQTERQISDVFIAEVGSDGSVDVLVQGQLLEQTVDTTSFAQAPLSRTFSSAQSEDSTTSFRVLHEPIRGRDASIVIALPTSDIDQSIQRLTLTFAIVTTAIAIILGVLAWWVWRLSLIPLARITNTADAIAQGDRDQRVPELSVATEAGRMARALNTMLDQRDESDDRLRQFVSDASHELRTPLTSIQGFLELYAAGGFQEREEMDDVVRRMTSESDRMRDMIENLLRLARMDEGAGVVPAPTDIGMLVRDVGADVGTAHPRSTITVDAPEKGQLFAEVDEQKVRQVLVGLVDNAIIHGDGAPVLITATTENSELCISVSDDGPGMTDEESARAFDRFYRGDRSRARHSGGSGLGLAIAKMVSEQHGGTLDLRTAVGQGATFTMTIPI